MKEFLLNGKIIDLSHEISGEIPHFGDESMYEEEVISTVSENGFYVKKHAIASQFSTHIDVPIHFVEEGWTLDDLPLEQVILPFYILHFETECEENSDFLLTVDHIKTYETNMGKIPPNTFVAFSSGWSKRWSDEEKFYNIDHDGIERTPGWSVEALEFLHNERAVIAVGHETLNTDRGLDAYHNQGVYKAELYWLAQSKYQIEVMNNLWQLPTQGGYVFVGVPKVIGASGFPCRVIAWVE